MSVHTALFLIAERWKESKRLSADEWAGPHSGMLLSHEEEGICCKRNLGDVMLSERSQSEKTTYGAIPVVGSVQNGELYGDRGWRTGSRGPSGRRMRGWGFSFTGDDK